MLRTYRGVARLLPARFRRRYFREAEGDLESALRSLQRTGGWWPVVKAGAVAVADIMRRLPAEWWAVLRGPRATPGGRRRPGTGEWTMTMGTDLRLAARALARRPTYALAALTTLGLGIGANVAIFTVVDAVVMRPLPYPDADRVVSITHHAPAVNIPNLENSAGTLNYYWKRADFLQSLAAYERQQRNLLGGPQPERVGVAAVTPQIFQVLQVQPALGRPFNDADAGPGASPVTLLTHEAWVSRFGADPSVLGSNVTLDGVATTVVGVMPAGFAFPDAGVVLLTPLYIDPEGAFGAFGTHGVARLAPGVTLQEAQRRIEDLQAGLPDYFPGLGRDFLGPSGWTVTLQRLQDRVVGPSIVSSLWIVLATMGFLLLIASANVANLFLVRAESRRKELAVRAAMGAGRGRLASGFLAEALLLGALGGGVGVGLAWAGVTLLVARGPSVLPRLHEVSVDGTSLLFAAAVSLVASLALGAIPMTRWSAARMASILRDGGRGSTDGRERHRTRAVLVASQLAVAVVLLVGSGLMLRSFARLRSVDPGIDPENVLTVGLSLGAGAPAAEAADFYQRVAERIAALPGVEKVGLATALPLGEGSRRGGSIYIDGESRQDEGVSPVVMYQSVGADYLGALRIPLLEGRALTRADAYADEPVALVNKAFEDRYLDGEALGRGIKWDSAGAYARVVGVVGNVREWGLRHEVDPWAYVPMVQGLDNVYLVIRSDPRSAPTLSVIRAVVGGLDASVPLTSARTMGDVVARDMAETSFTMALLGISSGVAVFLGAVGLFGVVSYVVSGRRREIGVRVALGARGDDIRRMVLRQSGRVVVAGVLVGIGSAFALTRLMAAVLFEVSTTDPVSFAVAPAVLLVVAFAATWLPARRATRVDPLEALRSD